MTDFINEADHALLAAHHLDRFEALWALSLPLVEQPNTERGGWSNVARLELGAQTFYLKRQLNHLTRSLRYPLGEPTFSREWRSINRYQKLGIPTLEVAFYGVRKSAGVQRAILLTPALEGWQDLSSWLRVWAELTQAERSGIVRACAYLVRTLHQARQVHGCLYPNHIFLRKTQHSFEACVIDLEKTKPLRFGRRDLVRDLEPLLRHASAWKAPDVLELLEAYLDAAPQSRKLLAWQTRLLKRRRAKEAR